MTAELDNLPPVGSVMHLAMTIHKKTPYIYDKAKTFWLWKGTHYEIVDIDDILSIFYDQTIDEKYLSGQFKASALTAIKLVGRKTVVKEKPKEWVHFKNCIIDLDSWERLEPSPEYLLTEPIPHNHVETYDTPTFDMLFKSWVEPKYVQTLYEVCAYVLLDDYPIHRTFLLFGNGRNGKGQFRDILSKLVGVNNITALTLESLGSQRFESSRLFKKKMCTMGETNFTLLEKTSMFKAATGGDPIPGEFKGGHPFTFVNTAKMVINSNSPPKTTDKTDGFYSRWVILDFINKFDKGKDIIDTIPMDEYDNFVSKLMPILRDLRSRGEFHEEGSTMAKMKKYEEVSNPLARFIENECVQEGTVPLNHFRDVFAAYLVDNRYRQYTNKNLRNAIKDEGFYLDLRHYFAELNKQMTAIIGLDLKDNPYIDGDRVNDGSLGDFTTTK